MDSLIQTGGKAFRFGLVVAGAKLIETGANGGGWLNIAGGSVLVVVGIVLSVLNDRKLISLAPEDGEGSGR